MATQYIDVKEIQSYINIHNISCDYMVQEDTQVIKAKVTQTNTIIYAWTCNTGDFYINEIDNGQISHQPIDFSYTRESILDIFDMIL